MGKETIICIIIIIAIIVGNIITQNYTIESVKEISSNLENLKEDISNIENQKNSNIEELSDKINQIESKWEERHNKLAYFLEHDELEKVETNLTALKSFIETNEYSEAISELDKAVFLLEHIEDKYAFNLQNVF